MTGLLPTDAILVAGHKTLARRLQDSLRHHAPDVSLSHVQCLQVIAALHGLPNWQTLLAQPNRSPLPEAPATAALTRALKQRGVHLHAPVLTQLLNDLDPVTATTVAQDIDDTPLKTQVALSLLLRGPIKPEPLRRLLEAEFARVSELRGFRYHPHPTSIFIWAFPSEAHHRAGAGQWAGMIQRSHSDWAAGQAPRVSLNEQLIRAVQAPATTRFGLAEATRRTLFLDHCRVTNRARLAADDAHPIGFENTREAMDLNITFKRARLAEWNAQLATQHDLSPEELQDVIVEGLTRSWPMASLQDVQTETIP